eukprot:CAMPEP_0176231464 /NCGR_PEP_ID=MMETSP0121_2-20121125/24814_1 /TAXON_ID=160619 /ORGANISM="Kryptoperidinium foliaceum, Strain CCMP 1326" /LENGTH=30 /DNA_ID= /DNA_START= /DNA_END= /DNA_ORIENTATION=
MARACALEQTRVSTEQGAEGQGCTDPLKIP